MAEQQAQDATQNELDGMQHNSKSKNMLLSPSGLTKAEALIKQTDLLEDDLLEDLCDDPSPLLLQSADDLLSGEQVACSPVRNESPMMKKPHVTSNLAAKAEDKAIEMAMADFLEERKGEAEFTLTVLADQEMADMREEASLLDTSEPMEGALEFEDLLSPNLLPSFDRETPPPRKMRGMQIEILEDDGVPVQIQEDDAKLMSRKFNTAHSQSQKVSFVNNLQPAKETSADVLPSARASTGAIGQSVTAFDMQQQPQKDAQQKLLSIESSWDMFEKICILGEGAYGTVYKVKALKTSILSGGARVELANNPEIMKKYALRKQTFGINMHSSVQRGNKVRSIIQDQFYVIKEIDTVNLPKEAAFEAMNEIEILAEIDSHFVIGYMDSFITETNICIIMEYCANGDLQRMIKLQNGKPFANNFLWKVFIHICLGLQYLHSRSIIHRDIKALNIFVGKDNAAKLGDFGGAMKLPDESKAEEAKTANLERIGEEDESEPSMIVDPQQEEKPPQKVGTPFYLAPELWHDKPCSKESDIWALGVVLYEMCAHKYPYEATDIDELQEKVLTTKYKQVPQGVTKDFNMIIKQCLHKKPDLRPSIEEIIFSDDFQNKAKINKITLPKHLNRQKLLFQMQTKKSLDFQDRKLIHDLSMKGLIPKDLALRHTSMIEEPDTRKLKSGDHASHTQPNSRPGSSQGTSPKNPGKLAVPPGQQEAALTTASSSGMNAFGPACLPQRTISQKYEPTINIQRPRLGSITSTALPSAKTKFPGKVAPETPNNKGPVGGFMKGNIGAKAMSHGKQTGMSTQRSNNSQQSSKFTAPASSKTSVLRAQAPASKKGKNGTAGGASRANHARISSANDFHPPPGHQHSAASKTIKSNLLEPMIKNFDEADSVNLRGAVGPGKPVLVCQTEPNDDQMDFVPILDLDDLSELQCEELLTSNLTQKEKKRASFKMSKRTEEKKSFVMPHSTTNKARASELGNSQRFVGKVKAKINTGLGLNRPRTKSTYLQAGLRPPTNKQSKAAQQAAEESGKSQAQKKA